jgi:hypothetical protein
VALCRDLGVAGIITNRPAEVLAALAEPGAADIVAQA